MNLSSVLKGGGLGLPLQLIAGAAEPALATAAGALAAGTGGAPAGLVRSLAATAAATAAGAARAAGAGKASTARKATAGKASTAKKATTAKKASTTKASGYATRLPADYAFLRDPKLSLEEKLSRFIGMLMTKSEQDLLRQMEKMAPGSTAAAGSTGSTGGTSGKSSKVSLWGLVKSAIPALGLASQVVGDAQLKALAAQVSGPVLAAACTAIGLPQLAPLAQKFGPQLVGMLTKDVQLDLGQLVGGGAGANTVGSGASGSTGGSGGTAKAGGGDATSEKAQLMELQRLQDRDKELFTLFSNMLRSLHDSRMVAIQNIR